LSLMQLWKGTLGRYYKMSPARVSAPCFNKDLKSPLQQTSSGCVYCARSVAVRETHFAFVFVHGERGC
jgi:hypothetical protein